MVFVDMQLIETNRKLQDEDSQYAKWAEAGLKELLSRQEADLALKKESAKIIFRLEQVGVSYVANQAESSVEMTVIRTDRHDEC